ncbi:MAG TPA: cytochrome c biogenesis protein CcdA [Bacillota bacterium]|nr:cytochrome C biogenesis protein [Clostridiales bacterium UBA9856]HOA42110.1 cytochrome c biogenesis protein CcdA [Bacillota bacterium]HPZ59369.1 cytochrome c biogenesis protein CcdA [Bacillota bacterium]HQC81723.1 cytochrome c biogenesis protein CcdA [Bacillota bacterium]
MVHSIEESIETVISMLESNLWFVPALAFIAGLLTSLTPCSLTSLPIVMSYISGTKSSEKRKALTISLLFALGMALVYTTLGVFASLLGELLHHLGVWWYLLLAAVTVLMALHMFGIIDIIPDSLAHPKSVRKGYAGAFAAGMLGGFFASHCALPVLVVLLAMVAEEGNLLRGGLLLLLFALGHSVFVIVAGTWTAGLEKMTHDKKYEAVVQFIKIFLGVIMLLLAAYLVYLGFADPHFH